MQSMFIHRWEPCTHNNFKIMIVFLQANSEAAVGKYVAGSVQGKAGEAGLFIKDHAY